eukprot:6190318-Pleurochrysis_carterae.AAC.1
MRASSKGVFNSPGTADFARLKLGLVLLVGGDGGGVGDEFRHPSGDGPDDALVAVGLLHRHGRKLGARHGPAHQQREGALGGGHEPRDGVCGRDGDAVDLDDGVVDMEPRRRRRAALPHREQLAVTVHRHAKLASRISLDLDAQLLELLVRAVDAMERGSGSREGWTVCAAC